MEDIFRRSGGEGSDPRLFNEHDISLFLSRNNVADEERNLGGDCFLHGCSPGLSDEKMVGGHEFGHLICPTGQGSRSWQLGLQDGFVRGFPPSGHHIHDHIVQRSQELEGRNGPQRGAAGEEKHFPRFRGMQRLEFLKLEPYRKSQHMDFFRRNPVVSQDIGRMFVGNNGAVTGTAVPSGVDLCRIRDHREKRNLEGRIRFPDFCVQKRKNRIRGGDDVGAEFMDQGADGIGELRKHRPHALYDSPAAEKLEYHLPCLGIPVDGHRVAALHQTVHDWIRPGVGIGHEHFGAVGTLRKNGLLDVPCGSVVPFPHTGCQEKDSGLFGVCCAQAEIGECRKSFRESRIRTDPVARFLHRGNRAVKAFRALFHTLAPPLPDFYICCHAFYVRRGNSVLCNDFVLLDGRKAVFDGQGFVSGVRRKCHLRKISAFSGGSRVNLKNLARHLNLSPGTVSRVLAGRGDEIRISGKTQERVRRAAADMGAQPNEFARSLRIRKSRAIGLLIPDISNPFFAALARSVEEQARKAGYAVLLADARESVVEEAECVRLLSNRHIDGLVVAPVGGECAHLMALKETGVPMVQVDRVFDSLDVTSVSASNFTGAQQAVRHLVSQGHRVIACLQGNPTNSANAGRVLGYKEALSETGIRFRRRWLAGGDSSCISGQEGAARLLALSPRPTAILAMGNLLALGALDTVRKQKFRIPQDLALVAFDDAPWAALLSPALSVVRQPVEELGRRAAKELFNILSGRKNRRIKKIILQTQLVLRESS